MQAKRMKGLGIGAVALWVAGATFAYAAEPALQHIRISKDGAGPSHLFWLNGPSQILPDRDVVGIVDPLLAAVRLYSVRRAGSDADPINDRLERLGACALPVMFRPWRILQLKNEVQLEGMPAPGKNGHNAIRSEFQSEVYSLKRDLVTSATLQSIKDAGGTIDSQYWNPAAAIQCGAVSGKAAAGRTAPFKAVRGKNRPRRTIILTNTADALTGTQALTVRARTGGKYFLFSVKELEPAQSDRVVQITEGVPTEDGMIRLNQRLLLFGTDGSKPFGEISFDDTHFRSKIGLKPLAVLPTGELLAMGKQITGDPIETVFRIQSCGIIGARRPARPGLLCSDESRTVVASRQNADSTPSSDGTATGQDKAASRAGENANSIFGRVSDLATFSWTVDAGALPEKCRTYFGCKVDGQNLRFVPLKGIRLTRGPYTQTGLPYAQTETYQDFDRFFEASGRDRLAKEPTAPNQFADALRNVKQKQELLPGNLMDNFRGDLGLDCSALVQLAWNGRPRREMHRTSTKTLQNKEAMDYRCPDRLPGPSHLRSGDAIGINVKHAAEHIVLYAANIAFDGASEFWLVLESSSSCDGVCWSVYDPSYFNGWGLYRASNRGDKKCPAPNEETSIKGAPFPATLAAWREKVVKNMPLRKD